MENLKKGKCTLSKSSVENLSEKPLLFVREASGLAKEIGPWSIIFFPIKASTSPWFFMFIAMLPFMFPGCSVTLSFIIAGIIVTFQGLALALMMVCMPRSGGNYVVIARGLHPLFGMLEGWRAVVWNPIADAVVSYFAAGFLGASILIYGQIVHNPQLTSLGQYISTDKGALLSITLALLVMGALLDFFGARWLKRFMVVISGLTVVGILLMIGLFLAHPPASVPSAWDAVWGSGAYKEIVEVAKANGWTKPSFSLAATGASLLVATGFLYPNNVAPLGGEVAKPRVSFMVGIGLSGLALMGLSAGIAAAMEYSLGDFLHMYDFVVMGGHANQLKLNPGIQPSTSFFASSLTTNPGLALFSALTPFIAVIGLIPMGYFWTTRPFYAMAMDRYSPEKFAYIHPRWHSPVYSVLYCFILSVIVAILSLYIPVILSISLFIYGTLLPIFWGWAAMTLPFHRPEIWNRGFRATVGGFPLMSIFGFITTAVYFYVLFMGIRTVDPLSIAVTIILLMNSTFWYLYYTYQNKKKGIDVDKIFAAVPPE
jgi:APA family basic amino acid/polyamine antiporter